MNDSKPSKEEDNLKPVQNVSEFLMCIGKIEKAGKQGKHLYRGIGNSTWDIKSTAEIRLRDVEKDFAESQFHFADDFVEHEKLYNHGLIEHFKLEEFNKEKSEILKTHLGILAQLRHYYAANSFIDFTGNPLIALWFACQRAGSASSMLSGGDGVVFAINTSNDKFVEISSEEQLRDYTIENIFSEPEDKWVFWKPTDLNKRIPAQDSYLLIGKTPLHGKESKDFIRKIIIDKDSKDSILKDLSRIYNINASRLFPDMHGFAEVNSKGSPYGEPKEIYEREIKIRDAKLKKIKRENKNNRRAIKVKRIEIYYHRGLAKLHLGDSDAAISDFNEVIHLDKKYKKAYFNLGLIKYRLAEERLIKGRSFKNILTRYGEVIGYLNKVIKLDPEDTQAYIIRGVAKFRLNEHEKAIKDFDVAIELDPNRKESYSIRGSARGFLGRYAEAIEDFEKVIEFDSGNEDAYFRLGQARRSLGDFEGAIKDLDIAINLDSSYKAAYFNRGYANNLLGRWEQAIKDFDVAIILDPGDKESYFQRGLGRGSLGLYKEAAKDFHEVIKLDPKDRDAYFHCGFEKLELGRYKQAIKKFDAAIKLDNDYKEAYFYRGRAKGSLGYYKEAIKDFDHVIKLDKRFAGVYFNRGCQKFFRRLRKEAIKDFNMEIKLNNKYKKEACFCRGIVIGDWGKSKQAIKDFDSAIKLDNTFKDAYFQRGKIKIESGLEEASILDFDIAITLDNNYKDAYSQRGLAKYKLGKKKKAIKHFEKALSDFYRVLVLEPGNLMAQRHVRLILDKIRSL